jgi:GT2 family glycosyltransferase
VHRGAIAAVVQFLEMHPLAWVAGCRLESADGSLQSSIGPFPSVLEGVLKASFLYLLLPWNAVIGSHRIRRFDYSSPAPVDWVMGAFFMIRREAIDRIGLLDEQFFMYSEEVDFCRRVWGGGHQVWYTPAGTVTHYWGGLNSVSGRTFLWLLASQFLYVKKHHRGLERFLMIQLKYAGLAFRAVAYACIGSLTLNRKLLAKSTYSASAIWRLLMTPVPALWKIQ